MSFSRKLLPTTALIGMLIWGCTGTPSQPPVTTGSPSASIDPSAAPTDSSSPGASASASAAVSTAPSAETVPTTTLRGTVFGEDGKELDSGSVRVKSLNPSRPFETTVQVISGKYVVNEAPINTQLEISATRPGWTTRSRVEALALNVTDIQNRNVINFGGPFDTVDPIGFSYFISNRPEIERVEPSDDSSMIPNDQMSFKLVMSEPLDTNNQRRLAAAFLLVPNNQEALGEGASLPQETATDTASATEAELVGLNAGVTPATTSAYRYRQNSGFLNGFEVSEFKWEADGRTATFTMKAPVKTDRNDEAEYAFLLVQADDDRIVDADNNPLGMDERGEFGDTQRGDVIRNAIREPEVSLSRGQDSDPEERWAQTHLSYSTFQVAPDSTGPTLSSVVARRNYGEGRDVAVDRIELTFSESMIAYPQISSRHLLSLNNYIITAGDTEEAVNQRTLATDGSAAEVNPGDPADEVRTAFGSQRGAVIGENGTIASTSAGPYSITMSVKDPRVVIIEVPGGYLPLNANFIRVYAGSDAGAPQGSGGSVSDPAGNSVRDNVKTGPIF